MSASVPPLPFLGGPPAGVAPTASRDLGLLSQRHDTPIDELDYVLAWGKPSPSEGRR